MNLFEIIHYIIGMIIVFFLVWIIIKVNNHFSKDNFPITSLSLTEQFVGRKVNIAAPPATAGTATTATKK
jgi:hypothetical protein